MYERHTLAIAVCFHAADHGCYGGANVGAHNHAYGLSQGHEPGVHEADGHNRNAAGTLNEYCDQRADKHPAHWRAGQGAHKATHAVAGKKLQGFAKELNSIKE